ncbi:MAG: hypothetical protein DRJ33_04120 [Candidatus Methanomethylicota archaeon]|uniref:Uncharacterized protein n=1 Tax=Thermoproteota archaeon TaxID=2056631 RepID=A0A497EZ74_9CREN|nr:MAG: hypothetical protein DRJ33_04120 [Candidatus Verstraetearchaeota archaeon]
MTHSFRWLQTIAVVVQRAN